MYCQGFQSLALCRYLKVFNMKNRYILLDLGPDTAEDAYGRVCDQLRTSFKDAVVEAVPGLEKPMVPDAKERQRIAFVNESIREQAHAMIKRELIKSIQNAYRDEFKTEREAVLAVLIQMFETNGWWADNQIAQLQKTWNELADVCGLPEDERLEDLQLLGEAIDRNLQAFKGAQGFLSESTPDVTVVSMGMGGPMFGDDGFDGDPLGLGAFTHNDWCQELVDKYNIIVDEAASRLLQMLQARWPEADEELFDELMEEASSVLSHNRRDHARETARAIMDIMLMDLKIPRDKLVEELQLLFTMLVNFEHDTSDKSAAQYQDAVHALEVELGERKELQDTFKQLRAGRVEQSEPWLAYMRARLEELIRWAEVDVVAGMPAERSGLDDTKSEDRQPQENTTGMKDTLVTKGPDKGYTLH